IDIPRSPVSSSASCKSAGTVTLPRGTARPPPLSGDTDYRTNARVKPPYSYATLICMAMEASKKPKITLAAICKWISDNFCYFRRADTGWQSAIRHNLCINKHFIKVPREKGEPGRGAFWKLHPQYAEWLKNNTFKECRALAEPIPPASSRRAQQEAQRVLSPASLAQSTLEVGAELQRLLQEFEEFESSHSWNAVENQVRHRQPWPTEASGLPSSAWGAQEEPGELTELKGSADWEALLNKSLEQGDFSTPEHLQLPPAPTRPGTFPPHPTRARGQCVGWPQGQQQVLPEPSPTQPGLDETLMATAFLEAAWPEETRENLSDCNPVEQGAENLQASFPEGDAMDWDSLAHLR
ncbi:FXJ1B protein, partial [Picathartes gymnocephalus]|nr:FXJ1B protein [Picathartes gymnocephalus]